MERRNQIKTQKRAATLEFDKRKRKSSTALRLTAKGQPVDSSMIEIIDALRESNMTILESEINFDTGRAIKGVVRFKSRASLLSKVKAYIPLRLLSRMVESLFSFLIRIAIR